MLNPDLVNGQLALVVQDESWNVQIAVSHRNSMSFFFHPFIIYVNVLPY